MTQRKVGDIAFKVELPGSSPQLIALFSVATEDPNPIHVDQEFALECGFPQIIQQGPMTTAHFARLLSSEFGQENLKALDISFTAPVFPQESLVLMATITAVDEDIVLELSAAKETGVQTAKGVATVTRASERL